MGMIGNQLAAGTALTVANDSFNGNGSTTAFTLSQTVSATTDIEVLVDNVQQSPYDSSYSVSGTTLTFSAAPASGTNNIYVIYNASKHISTNQVVPDDGSVTHSKFHTTALNPITLDQSNNRVGIGTTSPDGALHVKGSSDHGRIIVESGGNTGASNNTFIQFHNNGGTEVSQITVEETATNEGQMVFKTGGTTTNMTISKDGHVTKPNQPMFDVYVYNSGAGNPYSGGSGTHRVPFDAAITNIGSHFNLSNNRFTAPIQGVYQFNWNLSLYDVGSGNWIRQRVYINGSSYAIYDYKYSQTSADQNFSSSFAYKLNVSDYIEFYANSNDSTFYYSAGSHWNTCSGYLVG